MDKIYNGFNYSNEESTPSSDLTLTKDTIDATVDTLSEHMVVNPKKLLEDPKDGEWSPSDFLKCIDFPDDIYKYVTVPGLDFKELTENPHLEEFGEITERDSKLELLLFTEAMLNTAIEGIESEEGEVKLRDLMENIHPEWRYEMDLISKDLRELTYTFAEENDENRPLSSYFSNYKEKAYKVFAIVSIAAGMLTACNPVNSSENSNIDSNEKPTATETLLPSSTPSATPTVTPSPTASPTPTDTATPTQTFTPSNTPTRMSLSEDPEVRGFSYTQATCGVELNESCRTIEAKNVLIDSYKIEDKEIILDVTMRLNEKVFKETVRTKNFYWIKYSPPFNVVAEGLITSEDNLDSIVPIGKECSIGLSIEGQNDFPDELISDYINGYTDLSFDLRYLFCPVY